ncbi:MAG: MBL fold metallo-hydrolase [Gammaproteobacteria bacterium]
MNKVLKLLFVSLILLQVVRADYLEVTLLGTGTPRPSIERFGSATLVSAGGQNFLFDVGRGATIRLQQAGITPNQIDKVFLTHLHSDHISGLDDLWITGWVWQRQKLLRVRGPIGTHQLVEGLREAYAADISYRVANVNLDDDKAKIESVEIEPGVVYQQEGVTISAFLVEHAPVKPAYGYRVEFGDRSVVISGDTTYSENLVKHTQQVDLLIHEITAAAPSLLKRNKRLTNVVAYHTNPDQMADVLNKTKPRLAVLNHILLFAVSEEQVIDEIKQQYSGEVAMGYDLMKIGVGNSIQIQRINVEN